MKKSLSILLSIVLIITMTSGLNLTANAETLTGSCGESVTYTLDTETGELVISGTGAMTDYSSSPDVPWYSNSSSIKTVKINSGVTSIGRYAFCYCTSLPSVTIPNSVTSIGGWAFWCCKNLNNISIGNGVTSIGNSAFFNTVYYNNEANWKNDVLYIGNYLIEAKESISGEYVIRDGTKVIADNAFYDCISLTSVTIPNGVTRIGNDAFYFCKNLTSVTISNGLTSIGWQAFDDCTSLTSLEIPDSVTYIDSNAFRHVKNIAYSGTAIDENDNKWGANARNGYVDGYLIYSDSSKTDLLGCSYQATGEIVIPDTVTKIDDNAFYNCTKIQKVTIPDSVTSIGDQAFEDCASLTSITIPDSVTSIGSYAFEYCTSLTNLAIPNSVTSISGYAFWYVKNIAYNGTATDEWNDNWGANARNGYVEGYLVYSDSSKTELLGCGGSATGEIVIPDTVTKIDNYAFYGCEKIEKITIGSKLTDFNKNEFYYCTSLESITVDENNPYFVSADGVLFNKDKTELLIYPKNKASTSYVVPESVVSIQDTFHSCKNLIEITIPAQTQSIALGYYVNETLFTNCEKLTNIYVDENNSAYSSSDGVLFNKDKTELIKCPMGNNRVIYEIPNTVATIGWYAFTYCNRIEDIIIPKSVTDIGWYAFGVTKNLKNVYYGGSESDWNNISIYTENNYLYYANKYYNYLGTSTGDDTISTTQPSTTQPSTTQPSTTQPSTTQPSTTQPSVTQPSTTQPSTPNVAPTTTQTNAPAVNNVVPTMAATTAVATTAAPTTVATTTATTEATPAGAKKIDGVWVNSKYKKPSVSKVISPKKKQIKITWKRTAGVKGYEIQYSTSKKFTKKTTKKSTIKNNKSKKPSKTIKKLKSRKKYYVRIRSYKTVKINGKNVKVYSKWSKIKSVKTK